MKLLLTGGRILDPSCGLDTHGNLLVEDGKIAAVGERAGGKKAPGKTVQILDVTGRIVVPGLVDMHTHLREPGFEYKETIATGCRAAAAGGFTAIACMPNTNPVNDHRPVTEFILRKAAECGLCRVYPVAAVSLESAGKSLTEFGDLSEAGAVAFSDDGRPVMDSALMRRALEYASSLGLPVISHCEDAALTAGGQMNEGAVSMELGLQGIPSTAEEIMDARDLLLAGFSGAAVHIAHVSTAGSVRLIREAKARGMRVTAETAPHYFTLTEEALWEYDTNLKVNPPLRRAADVTAIREALRDGTIDAIASDHAPHASTDKDVEFAYAASGMIGLETSLGLSLKLVRDGILSLEALVAKMSTHPAAILNLPGGTLRPGSLADITVIDAERNWTVDIRRFQSHSRNSPFDGWTLTGKAVLTIKDGIIVFQDS